MKTIIIAEAGVNHNGDLGLALRLCEAARGAGADYVKFQTFKTEKILTKNAGLAAYQAENLGGGTSQYDMVKSLELSYGSFREIKRHCDRLGIRFLSTPDEEDSLDFLVDEIGVDVVKIGSGEVTNLPFLRAIGRKGLPVILSTGMASLGEVERAYGELKRAGSGEISLLHCTTNYPCPMEDANLRAIGTLREAFKTKVGYSDHTKGIVASLVAVALGAEILEKHFTLDVHMTGPDHAASMDPEELALLVRAVRDAERSLGTGLKGPTASEVEVKKAVRRSIVAARRIEAGETFGESNLAAKRTGGTGIGSEHWDLVIGAHAPRTFEEDEAVSLQ